MVDLLNETLEAYKKVLPNLKNHLKQDIMIGLTDGEKFVGYWKGDKIKADISIGDRLKPGDPMIETFKTGKLIDVIIPPEMHGIPFHSITSPIKDNEGRIVGTLGIGTSMEFIYNIENIVNDVQDKLTSSSEKISSFSDISEVLNKKSQDLMKLMDEIMEKSSEINNATKEISNIAMQTQILAINASVESVHAGNFGRGFSIVAQEMKELATTSQDSSKRIFSLIEGLSKKVSQNYEDLKVLFESFKNQYEISQQITHTINNAKDLTGTVIDAIHDN